MMRLPTPLPRKTKAISVIKLRLSVTEFSLTKRKLPMTAMRT